jgi:lysophospholipase L1-like esterase
MKTALFAMLLVLAGCGGGGGDEQCSILLNGDSTAWGYEPGGGGVRAAIYPELALQKEMDARFTGVTVRTGAVSGSTSTDALTQPRNATVILYNSGINDVAYGHGESTYWANLRELAKVPGVVFVTPLPVSTATKDYAGIMRAVAIEANVPLIDARAYAESRSDWWQIAPDGVHPSSEGYRLLVHDVLMPALVPMCSD